ncbi:MAG: DNA-directed RNA polymerase subunit alpha C-terminal domain-containing protein [Planctomycetota bacterium]
MTTLTAPVDLKPLFEKAESIADWVALRLKVGDTPDPAAAVRALIDAQPDGKAEKAFHRGAALWLGGRHQEALDTLDKGKETKGVQQWMRGCCLRELEKLDEAEKSFEEAEKKGQVWGTLGRAEVRIRQGRKPEAHDLLQTVGKEGENLAEYWYLRGLIADYNGLTKDAIAFYDKALDKDANHPGALFRTAYLADLTGDDALAMATYETLKTSTPVHVNTLINLGINYEDRENYRKAIECYRAVLKRFPNHPRARLFLKDSLASLDMYYDEEKEAKQNEVTQLLSTPVTEFELSVRSRNCLARMKIETLGDLIKKTEQELLSYKNFGETSLQEIKAILQRKNLRLGMQPGEEILLVTEAPAEAQDEVLLKPISELNFSVRVRKVMEKLEIKTLGDLTRTKESALTSLKNFGKTSLAELKKKLAEYSLSLAAE